jgi:predicted Rossmann-fold nucleotide-binding protein
LFAADRTVQHRRYPLSAIRYPLSAIRYPLSAILRRMTLSICVFCGRRARRRPGLRRRSARDGIEIARRGWTMVYGGGRIGLMGVFADAALEAGGRVIGVMPRFCTNAKSPTRT